MSLRTKRLVTLCMTVAMMAPVMQSCFTGVDSTPKITEREIKRQKVKVTPEQLFLSDIAAEAPAQWKPGKKLYVTDNRIVLIFSTGIDGHTSDIPDSLGGSEITLTSVDYATGLTGADEVQFTFRDDAGNTLLYRPGLSRSTFVSDTSLTVPFTIDPDMVAAVDARMQGNTYYLLTPRRTAPDGSQHDGLRYVPVTIAAVRPGDSNYPLRVFFTEKASPDTLSVLMTAGNNRTSTRNFDKLFSFDNPRKNYPAITDEVWEMIQHSRVRTGMTPDECRLALGAPTEYLRYPGVASVIERWTYGDGVYLFFEDGVLTRFRR